jgi:hypothetical protein
MATLYGPGTINYQVKFTVSTDPNQVMAAAGAYLEQSENPDGNGNTVLLEDIDDITTQSAGDVIGEVGNVVNPLSSFGAGVGVTYIVTFDIGIDQNTTIDDSDLTLIVSAAIAVGIGTNGVMAQLQAQTYTDENGNVTTLGGPVPSGTQSTTGSFVDSLKNALSQFGTSTITLLYVVGAILILVVLISAYKDLS